MNDKQLIKEIGRDNELAFSLFIKKYEKLVFSTAFKLVQNVSDAEDLSQDVFLSVYKNIQQLRNEDDPSGWLFRITYNKSLSFLRKKNPARANSRDFPDESIPKEDSQFQMIDRDTPSRSLEKKEAEAELFKAIDNLPEMQKKAFLLFNFEDHSYKEICEILNLSLGSVESLIFRAKANLRKSLLNFFNQNILQI